MNIIVCVKHIPDPNLPGELTESYRLRREGVQGVLDPGDEFGVEASLQLKEGHGGEVTLVSMGSSQAMEAIRRGLSMGADKGILISDDALEGADALVTARTLAAAITSHPFDLIIAGVESTDGYTGTMPATLAEFLGIPLVTFVTRIESPSNSTFRADRQSAAGYDVVDCPSPLLITVTAAVNEPRYASFKGIMAAKKKPVAQLSLSDLGLSPGDLGIRQKVVETAPAEERKAGDLIRDDGSAAGRIADFLKEAKVI